MRLRRRQFAEFSREKTPHPDHRGFSGQSGYKNVAKTPWSRNETCRSDRRSDATSTKQKSRRINFLQRLQNVVGTLSRQISNQLSATTSQ
jgi:hypothetical protein